MTFKPRLPQSHDFQTVWVSRSPVLGTSPDLACVHSQSLPPSLSSPHPLKLRWGESNTLFPEPFSPLHIPEALQDQVLGRGQGREQGAGLQGVATGRDRLHVTFANGFFLFLFSFFYGDNLLLNLIDHGQVDAKRDSPEYCPSDLGTG